MTDVEKTRLTPDALAIAELDDPLSTRVLSDAELDALCDLAMTTLSKPTHVPAR